MPEVEITKSLSEPPVKSGFHNLWSIPFLLPGQPDHNPSQLKSSRQEGHAVLLQELAEHFQSLWQKEIKIASIEISIR